MITNEVTKFIQDWKNKINSNLYNPDLLDCKFKELLSNDVLLNFSNSLSNSLNKEFPQKGNISFSTIYIYSRHDEKKNLDYMYYFKDNECHEFKNKEKTRSYRMFNKYKEYIKDTIKNSEHKFEPFLFQTYFIDASEKASLIINKEGYWENKYDEFGNREKISFVNKLTNTDLINEFGLGFKYFDYFIQASLGVTKENDFVEWETDEHSNIPDNPIPDFLCIWNLSIPNFDYLGTLRFEGFLQKTLEKEEKEKEMLKILNIINSSITEVHEKFLSLKQAENQISNEYSKWKIQQMAIKSALAAVMARNLSHNIGSHALVKAINDIKKYFFEKRIPNTQIQHEPVDRKITSLANEINILLEKMKSKMSCHEDTDDLYCCEHNIFIEELNKISKHVKFDDIAIDDILMLLNYLKIRMDYIADITTSTPVMENTKSLKNEVIKGFLRIFLLINTISGISEFKYKIKLPKDDFLLSIPNDVLGNHAFYVILENLIRNTAKHSSGSGTEFVFEIKIEEAEIYLKDYLQLADDKRKDEAHPNELYAVSIVIKPKETGSRIKIDAGKKGIIIENYKKEHQADTKGIIKIDEINVENYIDWIAFEQNEIINRSILHEETGQLRQGGWGILEIEASAAYLRRIPKEDIEKEEYDVNLFLGNSFDNDTFFNEKGKINILKAYVEDEKYLAYRFFVYKPREILLIVGEEKDKVFTTKKDWNDDIKSKWLSSGIKVIEKINEDESEVYPHRLVVDYTNNKNLSGNTSCFSRQILVNPQIKIDCANKDINIIRNDIWKYYIDNFANKNENFIPYKKISHRYSSHGENYNNLLKIPPIYVEIKTSDNQQWTDRKVVKEWEDWETDKWTISCNTKIKVIDERIQDFALKNSYSAEGGKKILYNDIYKNTRILIPDEKIDLNKQNFDETFNLIKDYIQDPNDNIDFLVIHLGIIEKLISSYKDYSYNKEKPNEIESFIKEVLCKVNNNDIIEYDKIIVISGRGKPHNLPKNIRFLNYSVVAQYLIDRRCKYTFAEVVHSARKLII